MRMVDGLSRSDERRTVTRGDQWGGDESGHRHRPQVIPSFSPPSPIPPPLPPPPSLPLTSALGTAEGDEGVREEGCHCTLLTPLTPPPLALPSHLVQPINSTPRLPRCHSRLYPLPHRCARCLLSVPRGSLAALSLSKGSRDGGSCPRPPVALLSTFLCPPRPLPRAPPSLLPRLPRPATVPPPLNALPHCPLRLPSRLRWRRMRSFQPCGGRRRPRR